MKKSNKKGFVLAETIAVSTVVMTSLVIIYTQFVSINNSYNRSFKYNNVNNLYLVENVRNYITDGNLNKLVNALEESNSSYIDITSCPNNYFLEYIYCQTLFNYAGIKTILFTKEDLTDLKNNLTNTNFNETMKEFITRISTSDEDNYRLIVEFTDDTFATLKIKI